MTQDMEAALRRAPLLPVLTVENVSHAAPLARALAEAGLAAIEVTLRTPVALEAIKEMRAAAPDLLVGAGTLLSPQDVARAIDAGAQFLVTPGATPKLAPALLESGLPAFPGIATASEAMARLEEGFTYVKFFPAQQSGGAAALKALAGPLPHLKIVPTGGIGPDTLKTYLALPSVLAVGGSWFATADDFAAGAWRNVTERTRRALQGLA